VTLQKDPLYCGNHCVHDSNPTCSHREELTKRFRDALQAYLEAVAEPSGEDTTAALIRAGECLNSIVTTPVATRK